MFLRNELKSVENWLNAVLMNAVDIERQTHEQTMEWVDLYPEGIMTEYFREEIVPQLLEFNPDLVGFSWIDYGQVLPTLLLLKRRIND